MTETSNPTTSETASRERVIIQINASGIMLSESTDLSQKEPITTGSFSEQLTLLSYSVHGNTDSFISELLAHLASVTSAAMSQKNLKARITANKEKRLNSHE